MPKFIIKTKQKVVAHMRYEVEAESLEEARKSVLAGDEAGETTEYTFDENEPETIVPDEDGADATDWQQAIDDFQPVVEMETGDGSTGELYAVEWDYIGEGNSGDYDDQDADDVPRLRFTTYKMHPDGKGRDEVDSGSYCTQLPVNTPDEELRGYAREIIAAAKKERRELFAEFSYLPDRGE